MSQTAGQLFVELGVKGSEKTLVALGEVKSGLGGAKSMAFETKAAIIGAVYALERLFANSGKVGTQLTNFNALTGLSTRQLQQWQYALIMAGGSAEEMTSSLMGVQKMMAGIDLNKGVPGELFLLSSKVKGGIDFQRAKTDYFYFLSKIQEALKGMGNSVEGKSIANYLASAMGLGPNVIAAMQRGMFNPAVFARAPVYNEGQIASITKNKAAMEDLLLRVEKKVGDINARHGGALIADVAQLTHSLLHLVDALDRLGNKLGVFTLLGRVAGFTSGLIDAASVGADELAGHDSGANKKRMEKDAPILKKIMNWRDKIDDEFFYLLHPDPDADKKNWEPAAPVIPHKEKGRDPSSVQTNINQSFNLPNEYEDPARLADEAGRQAQAALRQSSALFQVS